MKNNITFICCSLILLLFLGGCSGTYKAYKETLSYAFNPPSDIQLTLDQVKASGADLLAYRYGEQRQVVLALAFIEHNQQKWLSEDNAVVVLQHGRVVRTAGFKQNLLFVTAAQADPLSSGLNELAGSSWQSLTDWQHDEYGYRVQSQFGQLHAETLEMLGQTFQVYKVTETLTYKNKSQFWRFDQQWQNQYWFEQGSGILLKSRQQYAPFQPVSEMLFLSRAARLVSAG